MVEALWFCFYLDFIFMKPKALILRTAGINCDKETTLAFELAGAEASLRHINYVKEAKSLSRYQIICFPGGFSYGDDLGAGKIFSLELLLWLKDELKAFIGKGGLVLGICNGFQVMVKTGILPDADFRQKVTLSFNDCGRFVDRWIYLKTKEEVRQFVKQIGETSPSAGWRGRRTRDEKKETKPEKIWTKGLPEVIRLPIAHGEGKFLAPQKIVKELEAAGRIAFRYCDDVGGIEESETVNPNGSLRNIAGITDATGRILGLMPHPERCMFEHQIPDWHKKKTVPWGLRIFQNAVNYFLLRKK